MRSFRALQHQNIALQFSLRRSNRHSRRRPSRASTTIILIIKTYFIWHILSSSRMIYDSSYKNLYENDCTCENIAWQSFSFWLRQPMFWMLFRNCFCLLWLCKESCGFTLKIDHQKPYEFTRFAALDGWLVLGVLAWN